MTIYFSVPGPVSSIAVTPLRVDAVLIMWTPPLNTVGHLEYYQIVVQQLSSVSSILVAVENVSVDHLSVIIGLLGMISDSNR